MTTEHLTQEDSNERDVALLRESAQNPDAFEGLVKKYQEAFVRKAFYMLRDKEMAEDLVQETFVKIYLNASKYTEMPGIKFSSWAYKILVNLCLTYIQKEKRKSNFEIDLDPEYYETLPDERDEGWRGRTKEALSILSRLPVAFQEILRPVIEEGKTHKDLAKDFGVKEGAIRVRLHRAKKEFRKMATQMGL